MAARRPQATPSGVSTAAAAGTNGPCAMTSSLTTPSIVRWAIPFPAYDVWMKRCARWMHDHERAVGAFAVVAAATVALVVGSMSDPRQGGLTATGSTANGSGASELLPVNGAQNPPPVDYLLDLNTGATTPLPTPILRSLGDSRQRHYGSSARYAVSPDRSRLAFVGSGDEGGRPQIFIAGIVDGSGLRQVTHDRIGARAPTWSPDGLSIAYEGYGGGQPNLYVIELDTGYATEVKDPMNAVIGTTPQYTPDGSSLVYTDNSSQLPQLRSVPIGGGGTRVVVPLGGGLEDSRNGSLSPDGSLVTFLGSGTFSFGHCGPCRWVANVDGRHRRVINGCFESDPAGTWSPDGNRIVCGNGDNREISVVDLATESATPVARANAAIWIDRHTLLIDV